MAMDSVTEPSKWVCRLTTVFDKSGEEGSSGTGFLVHIPNSAKFCIMTAGHNIIDPELGWAKKIQVIFPGGLTFFVGPAEYRVSNVFEKDPTNSATNKASLLDYGLIMADKEKHLASNPGCKDPGGCGFDILMRDVDLLNKDVSVYGYKLGAQEQTMNASRLNHLDIDALYYSKETKGGVSGGPVMISKNGAHTAIGIHNYDGRATRLTCAVMLEILSWIDDYQLRRVLEVLSQKNPRVYLQATDGVRPSITARPQLAYLNFVLAVVPKAGSDKHSHYVILPGSTRPTQRNSLLCLTLLDEISTHLTFHEERRGAHGQIRIDIQMEGPRKQWAFLCWPQADKQILKVKPRKRTPPCDFGCITQDDEVVADRRGTKLFMSSYNSTDHGTDIQDTGLLDLPPLYRAVLRRNLEEVKKLLDRGADAAVTCTCGTTALSKAAENGDLLIVDALMKHRCGIETKNCDGETPEILAHRNGHIRVTNRLQYFRCQLLECLLYAAKKGSTDEIRNLIRHGVVPNARNVSPIFASEFFGRSALEIAAWYGHQDTVRFLLQDAKVAVTEADARGITALHQAAQNGHAMVIRCLLNFGANVNAIDKTKMTPLHRAAERGHVAAISALCADARIDLNVRGTGEVTPLMLAAQNGRTEAVKLLIELSADMTLMDRKGETARDKAEIRGRLNVVDVLPFI